MEKLYPERTQENLNLLGHHFSHAEVYRKAVGYSLEASQKYIERGQSSEALAILDKARDWLLRLPDDTERQESMTVFLFQMERVQETFGARDEQ